MTDTGQQGKRQVVIVGGGFAGLFAVRALRRSDVSVTMIDRSQHHVFAPLLYQCATGILSEGKIAIPLRELLKRRRNVTYVLAEATGIDAAARTVRARRPLGEPVDFGYDYLILAAGVRQSYFGHDEYAAIAPGMKTIEDARKIRRRVFGAFELADSADDPAERARWLTFALVGAGPTGVELAGQIREVATKTLRREYRRIKPEDARVMLFEGGDAPLAMLEKFFEHGNWGIRSAVQYRDLLFVNQVNGGDEWWTVKIDGNNLVPFESITMRAYIKDGRFAGLIEQMCRATIEQCKSLTYGAA